MIPCHRPTLLAFAVASALALTGCGSSGHTDKPLDLTILHTNDHHSHLDADSTKLNLPDASGATQSVSLPLGGFARVTEAVAEIGANGGNVLKLHAGDAITGDLYYTQSEGAADAAMMNTVCFDAFTLGNHEFDGGDAELVKFIDFLHADPASCNTPVLSANLEAGGEALRSRVQPYTVVERDGQKIGIIGITAAYKTKHASSPDADTDFADEATSAQSAIDALRKQGVDKIVLMSHEGYDADLAIAPRLSGVDVIVGGDSHTLLGPDTLDTYGLSSAGAYPSMAQDKDGKPVCVVQAWQYAYAVGELHVQFDKHGDITGCSGMPHVLLGDTYMVSGSAPSDADATAFRTALDATGGLLRTTAPSATATAVLEPYKAAKDALGLQVIGSTTDNLCLRRVPGDVRDTTRSKLGDVCNLDPDVIAHGGDIQQLVAEAFLAQGQRYGGADFALQNAGGVRVDIAAGDITVGKIYELLPFKNLLVRLTLSGTELKSALEDGVDSVINGTGTGAYPYVAGLRFDVDMGQSKGNRVTNLQKRQSDGSWTSFDSSGDYTLVTNDFTAGGGDNYLTLADIPDARRENTFLDYADAFLQYVTENTPLSRLPVSDYSTQQYTEAP